MKILVKKKPVLRLRIAVSIREADLMELITEAGVKGITAREASKRLRGRPDPVAIARVLRTLPGCAMSWTPCPDWRVHYAAQEGRWWITNSRPKEMS